MTRILLPMFWMSAVLLLAALRNREPGFGAPSPDRITALMAFDGPVTLKMRALDPSERLRTPFEAVPLAVWSYANEEQTSHSLTVALFRAGAFGGSRRARLVEQMKSLSTGSRTPKDEFGMFPGTDGRTIMQFPLGFGPGGAADAALIPCRDPRFELVVIESVNFHDDEDGKSYAHHCSPSRAMKDVIETVERLAVE